MRLAVLSDIHGNLPALEAVLADIEAQGTPDEYWILGDLVVFCPWPSETLQRLQTLPNASFLQGNTDRYVVTGQRPAMDIHSADDWAKMPTMLAGRDANFRWTVEQLSYAEYEFLRDLPLRLTFEVSGYGPITAVHATPDSDEDRLLPDTPDDQVQHHLSGLDTRLLLYGHIHHPVDRMVGDIRLVNSGSVGLPFDDPRPSYALLDWRNKELTITVRRAAYDRQLLITEMERVKHPAREWVSGQLRK